MEREPHVGALQIVAASVAATAARLIGAPRLSSSCFP